MTDLNPVQWAIRPLKHYADFKGRAARAEYWWWCVGATLLGVGTAFIDQALTGPIYADLGPVELILVILMLIPGAAVTIRRLHDSDRSGWWFLLNLWSYPFSLGGLGQDGIVAAMKRMPGGVGVLLILAFIAAIVILFVFMIARGTEGANRFGPDPYGPGKLEEVFA